ncbi:interleukin-18-like [Notamacropus eugenii]|uniref:interleukin-18-like n=1 Tax=Notamacropus eugenii TaxID=9315 RepID=UPI003B67A54E
MAAVDDCPEVACAPEADFDLDFAHVMESKLREDASCLSGEALLKRAGLPICIMLKNSEQKVLFFSKKKEMAIFEEMSDGEIEDNAPWTKFMLQYYGCDGSTPLVAISVRGENKSYLLTCKSDKELQFKDSDFPDKIEDGDNNILFWLNIVVGRKKLEFKSFLYPEHYLACEENKLVLKEELDSEEASTTFTYMTCKRKENC